MSKKILMSGWLLSLSLFAFFPVTTFTLGCNSCGAEQPKKKKKKKKKKKASKAELKKRAESGTKAQSVIPNKDTTTMIVYKDKERMYSWIEGSSGLIVFPIESSKWTGNGFIYPEVNGWRYRTIGGTTYLSTVAPTEGEPVANLLKNTETEPPPGYSVELKTNKLGGKNAYVIPAKGKKSRLGIVKSGTIEPVWMEVTPAKPRSAPIKPLAASTEWQREENGTIKNLPPSGTTVLPKKVASKAQTAMWSKDLVAFRKAKAKVHFSVMVDLDGDQQEEGVFCVTGGNGLPCYIWDKENEVNQYYYTSLKWLKGDDPAAPVGITANGANYVMFGPIMEEGKNKPNVAKVIRFNGHGYVTETRK